MVGTHPLCPFSPAWVGPGKATVGRGTGDPILTPMSPPGAQGVLGVCGPSTPRWQQDQC